MALISLTPVERESLSRLREVPREAKNRRFIQRIDALLSLDRGDSIRKVARDLGVSRGTIYNWIERFKETRSGPTIDGLIDKPRRGRPRKKLPAIEEARMLERLIRFLRKSHGGIEYFQEGKTLVVRVRDEIGKPRLEVQFDHIAIDQFQPLFLKLFLGLDDHKKPPRDDRGE